ncbi:hypothetical protein LTR84_002089 [Exophiala bonariae]|uniref:F-box domain-containing protein n=1 Tax=Exophiala bonariae TaxID=1690606 RepID=A0AAV9NAK3_9EURO|nr:hypothetical protein LTR84_002089 [Exophiala bonariae]
MGSIVGILDAETSLKKEMTSLRAAVQTIRDHKIIQEGRKITCRQTNVPAEVCVPPSQKARILTGSQVLQATSSKTEIITQDDIISRFPPEIQEMVWQGIDSTDRAALALTCKGHAAVFEELKNKEVVRNGKLIRRLPRPFRVDKAARLKVLVRLKEWMPAKYRLCYSCNLYVDSKKMSKLGGRWGGDNKIVESGLATMKAIKEGPRCPLCVRREQVDLAKHKQDHQKYLKLGRKIQLQ